MQAVFAQSMHLLLAFDLCGPQEVDRWTHHNLLGDKEMLLETNCSRGAALAEAFFFKLDADLKNQLSNQLEHESRLQNLQAATGIRDKELLDHLANSNLQPSELVALTLVPSVFVAWADGWVTDEEDRAVIGIAVRKGIHGEDHAMALVKSWLTARPPKKLWDLWRDYAEALSRTMPPKYMLSLTNEIVQQAEQVARASGGWLGFGKISWAEQAVLDETRRVMSSYLA